MSHNNSFIRLEINPVQIFIGRHEKLPYPTLFPVQQFVFDVGITASQAITINSVMLQVFAGSQLISQRQYTSAAIARWVGEQAPVRVLAGEGIAVRRCFFLEPSGEKLTQVFVTVTAKTSDGQEHQAAWGAPLFYYQQQTELRLPFQGTWWAIMGNDWSDLHKGEPVSQPFAFDFVKLGPENTTFQKNGLALEDHFSFEQPVLAPAAGEIIVATSDMPDNNPGETPTMESLHGDPRRTFGNALFVAHSDGEFSFLAHLQENSINVHTGERVSQGQHIANCGNSGASPGPHLHFHVQNGPHLFVDQGLPIELSHFDVTGDHIERGTIPTRLIVTANH